MDLGIKGSLHTREEGLTKSRSLAVSGRWCVQCPKNGTIGHACILEVTNMARRLACIIRTMAKVKRN